MQSSAVICGSRNEAHKREMNGHKAPCAESQGNLHGGSLTRRDPKCVKQFNGSLSGCEFCPLQRAHVDHRDFILSPLYSSMTHHHHHPLPFFFSFLKSNFISRTFDRRSTSSPRKIPHAKAQNNFTLVLYFLKMSDLVLLKVY